MKPQKSIGLQVVPGKVFDDFSMAGFLPKIKSYTAGDAVGTGIQEEISVELDMLDVNGVIAWALITPPDYQPPSVTADYTTPDLGLNHLALTHAEDTKTFTGDYTFPCNGVYSIVYYVRDKSGNVISSPAQEFVATGGSDCGQDISSGWNLLSLPKAPTDKTVEAIFGDIKDNITSVWKWVDNKWAVYLPGATDGGVSYAAAKGFNPLEGIGCGEGFWVNSDTAQTLTVSGTQPVDTSCNLTEGWNLMGLKSIQGKSITDLVSGNETKIVSIWKWDSGTWAVYLPGEADGGAAYAAGKGFNELSIINPGEGFWMNCTEAVTLE